MTLRLTAEKLARGYMFLRACEPFSEWGLPPSHAIKFKVNRAKDTIADFAVFRGVPHIRVSANGAGHTETVLAALGHEMIHLRQHLCGDMETHGPRFQKAAKRVCAVHGWDLKTF